MKKLALLGVLILTWSLFGEPAPAGIERLDLSKMVARIDDAVYGGILAKRAFRIDHPVDGPGLYFTTLTLDGHSLVDGRRVVVDVTYAGGWIDEDEGVWNSEAPREEHTDVGERVVVFYKWTENMGGDVAANAIYAAHGGLFRTVPGPQGRVVLGQGTGYAVSANLALDDLEQATSAMFAQRDAKGGGR